MNVNHFDKMRKLLVKYDRARVRKILFTQCCRKTMLEFSQSMQKPPAVRIGTLMLRKVSTVHIRCLGQGLFCQAFHTPFLQLHSYDKRTMPCTEVQVIALQPQKCHKAIVCHTTRKIIGKSRPTPGAICTNLHQPILQGRAMKKTQSCIYIDNHLWNFSVVAHRNNINY